jgi:type IV pilus assembly protein PilO
MASPLVDRIQKISPKVRAIIFGVLIVALLVVDITQFIIPMRAQIEQLEKALADKQGVIRKNDEKIRNLDALKAEVKNLQLQLRDLTEQLPPESEVSGLLRQIQDKVNQSGLVLKLWKPGAPKNNPNGLYKEIPVTLTLTGGYHSTAAFFDRVSKLNRIVNILNIKMSGAKFNSDGSISVEINCTAMTFSAVEKKVETTPTPAKKVK